MFPSSDPAIPKLDSLDDLFDDDPTMPSSVDDTGYTGHPRSVSNMTADSSSMEIMPSLEMAAMKSARASESHPVNGSDEVSFVTYDEFAAVQPPARSSKTASYSGLSTSIRPSFPGARMSKPADAPHSPPESPTDSHPERYPDDIRRSASSTDADLFSDVEDSDSEDEPSGFEPTETADIPISASGGLDPNDEVVNYGCSSDAGEHEEPSHLESIDYGFGPGVREAKPEVNRFRTVSCDSYPNANSPTESQLVDEGFEFHNQLPEEKQATQFEDEAFRDALKEISPDLPRKQQWYAWRRVMDALDHAQPEEEEEDLFDDSELPNDFSLGSLANHTFGGCQCGGDDSKCSCAPEHCGCSGCPRKARAQDNDVPRHVAPTASEEEPQDIPMVIGYTPITPAFPNLQYTQDMLARESSAVKPTLPGLGHLNDAEMEGHSSSYENAGKLDSLNPNCGCSCGNTCRCPEGQCRCEKSDQAASAEIPPELTVEQLFDDPFKRPAAYFHPQETWSDAATAAQSPAPSELREPRAPEPPFPQIATQLSHASAFSANDAPTPDPGPRSPKRYSLAPGSPSKEPVSRPDTPRPQGDSYEYGIRESVEPELPTPISHRETTPAYEDRSGTPSPISHQTPSDTSMHDATPTQLPAPGAFTRAGPDAFEREGSVLPDAPPVERTLGSPPDSPIYSAMPPVPAIPAQHLNSYERQRNDVPAQSVEDPVSQYSQIPVPPMPTSPTLKPRKQRATSTSNAAARRNTKSAVHGSKISKAQPKQRSVTRKATGKKVQTAVDKIEDSVRKAEQEAEVEKQRVSSSGSAKNWAVESNQKDGSPPRRSARLRHRTASPSPLHL
jgi:hypothetical protein